MDFLEDSWQTDRIWREIEENGQVLSSTISFTWIICSFLILLGNGQSGARISPSSYYYNMKTTNDEFS